MTICLTVLTLQAQSHLERKDFTFKITKEKNADGEINLVNLCTYVGNRLIEEYSFELDAPVSEDMAEHIGTISEEDINFDGYPDVDIYLGYWGGFANNTQHDALLWDQSQHRFVRPEGYSGIGEPQLDSEQKVITTVLSAGPDERVTTYYKWEGQKLQEYLTNTWAIEDDVYVDFSGMLNLPLLRYDAKLDGRISVVIALQCKADGDARGYIYYPKAKKPAPIMINGSVVHENDTDSYDLKEYLPGGAISGYINFKHKASGRWDYQVEGTWTHPTTGKQMKLTDVVFSHECPKWFTKSLFPW